MKTNLMLLACLLFMSLTMNAVETGDGKGSLNIETFPEGVTITLLGQEYKNTVEIESMDAGSYKCMFRKEGYQPVDTVLVVKAGVTNYYNIVLSPEVAKEEVVAAKPVKSKSAKTPTQKVRSEKVVPVKSASSTSSFASNMSYLIMLHGTIGKGLSEGGMLGAMYKENGVYVKGLMTLGTVSNSKIHANVHGNPSSLDKEYRTKEILVGYLRQISGPVIGYVGVGYGHHRTFLKQNKNYYLQDIDAYEKGVAFEVGAIWDFKPVPVAVSIGYNTVNFGAHAVDVGVGVKF